jgi:hypothetical protein
MYESVELGRLGRLYARVELGSISGRDSALYIPTSVSGSYVPGFSPQPGLEKNKLYNITFFYISTTMTQVWSQFYDRWNYNYNAGVVVVSSSVFCENDVSF